METDKLPQTSQECTTLAEYRDRVLGKTQPELARASNVKQATISGFETGRKTKALPSTRAKLAAAYSLQPDEFWRLWMNSVKARALQADYETAYPLFAAAAGGEAQVTALGARKQEVRTA